MRKPSRRGSASTPPGGTGSRATTTPRAPPARAGGHVVELDHDVAGFAAPPWRGDLAPAMDRRAITVVDHGKQLAGVADARDLAAVGRRRHVVLLVEAVQRVGHGGGYQPAGLEVTQRALQEGRAPAR